MGEIVRRLWLGVVLILAASTVLLVADRHQRREEGGTPAPDGETEEGTPGAPGVAGERQTPVRMQLVHYVESPTSEAIQRGLIAELAEHGLTSGSTLDLEVQCAQGDMAVLMSLVDAAVAKNPEVLVTTSTPTLQVALKKVKTVPIVFSGVADPVLAGAGESFESHLPGVTGISTMSAFREMIDLVTQSLPEARRLGTLFVPNEVNSVYYRDVLKRETERGGLELVSVGVAGSAEVADGAQALVAKGVDVICQISDNVNNAAFTGIVQAARKEKVPLFSFVSTLVKSGGAALAVSRDYEQAGRDAATMAMRVLAGEKPVDIPFQFVSRTFLVVNEANARQCGFTIPSAVLEQAIVVGEAG